MITFEQLQELNWRVFLMQRTQEMMKNETSVSWRELIGKRQEIYCRIFDFLGRLKIYDSDCGCRRAGSFYRSIVFLPLYKFLQFCNDLPKSNHALH